MSDASPDVILLDGRVEPSELRRLLERFGDMVKYVVDVERRVVALGGEMHANYYPGRGPEACIEYTSLINIRPSAGNPGMELLDPALRERLTAITFAVIGRGEPV